MEKRNQKLTIIVGALLLVIGVSFSYFLATSLIKGNGASTVGTTAVINGATLNVEGTLEFDDTGILPGHKNVSAIKVTATGNNQLIAYNLIWKGETGISQINYTVYKSSTPKTISTNCSNKTSVVNGMQVLSEECIVNNIDTLGKAIVKGSINKGDTKVILAKDEFITATSSGTSWYYYVVLEYPNLDIDQSSDVEATFEGEVTVEESSKEADINILAVYVADDSGNYTETTDIPQSGYSLNNEKSTCSNGATIEWQNSKLITSNLTKSGTSCYLYFDKGSLADQTLAKLGIKNVIISDGEFTSVETGPGAVYSITNDNGTNYYYRGAVTNNYVTFAGFCWRIIRINVNGSIRMIYDGTSCHANGTNGEVAIADKVFHSGTYGNAYVGYMYGNTGATTYSETHANINNSVIKNELDSWFDKNLAVFINKIDSNEGFCNDRRIATENEEWWKDDTKKGYLRNSTAYAPWSRVYDINGTALLKVKPLLECTQEENDLFTPSTSNKGNKKLSRPIGLITIDEIILAGGYPGQVNNNYYLNNCSEFWTMSPSHSKYSSTEIFFVTSSGYLDSDYWSDSGSTRNIRPVINLRSDITFSSGNGEQNTPFVVAD